MSEDKSLNMRIRLVECDGIPENKNQITTAQEGRIAPPPAPSSNEQSGED